MLGYYDNPELTDRVLVDGWFHTGDLGYIDEDGFLIITGRKKNVIVTKNGKNIFPEELEFLLNRSPLIQESVISGEDDGRDRDLIVTAEIFPDRDAVAAQLGRDEVDDEAVLEALRAVVREVNQQVPAYKAIRRVKLRDSEFAKNTSKKILRQYGPKQAQ